MADDAHAARLGWKLTTEAAVPLYVSVISDTGGFRHANTNAEALHVVARVFLATGQPEHGAT